MLGLQLPLLAPWLHDPVHLLLNLPGLLVSSLPFTSLAALSVTIDEQVFPVTPIWVPWCSTLE